MRSRFLGLALILAALSLHALEVPPAPKRWVTDRAGVLSTTEVSLLDSKLENFEQTSGAQFIVYVLPSTEGAAIEDFTIGAAREWGVGQPKYKNGLILFVFIQDRKARVEVGDGLEGTVTDAFASRILREFLAPPFQRGAYGEGLNAAADAIIQKIKTGEEPVPPLQPKNAPQPRGASESSDISPFTVIIIMFVIFFVIVPMLSRGRRGGGGCGGCLPLFFLSGVGRGVTFGGGGFSSGGGGWSSGGGGGGGFSGGGGGFSGGGATGGW